MSHRIFYSLVCVALVIMISVALLWPQGEGAVSPPPFGHDIPETDKQKVMREREEARLLKLKSDEKKSAARLDSQSPDNPPPIKP
jgi:hypothetical protein